MSLALQPTAGSRAPIFRAQLFGPLSKRAGLWMECLGLGSPRGKKKDEWGLYIHTQSFLLLYCMYTPVGGRAMGAGKSGTQTRPLYWLDLSSSIGWRSWPLLIHLPKLTCQSLY